MTLSRTSLLYRIAYFDGDEEHDNWRAPFWFKVKGATTCKLFFRLVVRLPLMLVLYSPLCPFFVAWLCVDALRERVLHAELGLIRTCNEAGTSLKELARLAADTTEVRF